MRRLGTDTPKNVNGTGSQTFDLFSQVQELFSTFPWVLIIKDDKQFRCSCYDPMTESHDTKHDVCLGTGWIPNIEKHRCHWRVSGVPMTLPRMVQVYEPVVTATDARFFYFLPNAEPEKGDTIVVAEFDEITGLPKFDDMEFYEVSYADILRDEQGRKIFCKVATEINPVDSKIRAFSTYKVRNEIKIIPIYS
jgi:hypothetical protein